MEASTLEKVYTYDEALELATEYFEGEDLPAKVFLDKYALRNEDNKLIESVPSDMHWRMAKEFARIEQGKFKDPLTAEQIFGLFNKYERVVPQGSPSFGIGNDYQIVSLSNCYLLNVPDDSYASILRTDEQLVQICKRRGGVGIDLSNLRPDGTPTKNSSRTSTGIVPFMRRYSNSIREVGQANRRGALMLTIDIRHPEVLDFAKIKSDPNEVTGANISVRLSDEFLLAAENDEMYEHRWPITGTPKITKLVRAKEVWDQLVYYAWFRAEPGLLFWDTVKRMTPADCYPRYASKGTNPCSELNLSELDSCRLILLNLYTYVQNRFTEDAWFDYDAFRADAKLAQRLMDDLVDLEAEKIQKILDKIDADPEDSDTKKRERDMWVTILSNCVDGRRTGIGPTAVGDMLAALNMPYGSEQSIQMVEDVYRAMKLACYESSIEMAEELGPFKEYDAELEKDCPYIQRIAQESPALYSRMVKSGRRNVAILTTAPAGSKSIETQTTSGIEPVYKLEFTRRKKINHDSKDINNAKTDFVDQSGDKWQEFTVHHKRVQDWEAATGETDVTKSPWYGSCAEDIDWVSRVKLQAAAQRHVCHSISSTINLPETVTVEEVGKIYKEAWKSGCKGITVYRNNCRTGVLVDVVKNEKKNNDSVKRPKTLKCDVHHVKTRGEAYLVCIGLYDGQPYEVLAAKTDKISHKAKQGFVTKVKRGHYRLDTDTEETLDSITDLCSDEQEAITRVASTSLRHGVPLEYLVHQLEKSKGDLQNFGRCISRTLKKYVEDGIKVTGVKCENCGGTDLIRQEGCVRCMCGWTKCS